MMCAYPGCGQPKSVGKGRKYCAAHRAEAAERRRIQNVQRVKAWVDVNREWHSIVNRANRYGITAEEFLSLLEFQDGCCAICRIFGGLQLEIDHDHVTGEVRGLLCGPCNRLLALAHDRPHTLEAAAAYLLNPIADQAREPIHGVLP